MKIFTFVCLSVIAICLGLTAGTAVVAVQGGYKTCKDFAHGEAVELVYGFNQGGQGIIVGHKFANGNCYYKVHGQRGVEMPFRVWTDKYSLISVK